MVAETSLNLAFPQFGVVSVAIQRHFRK